MKQILLELVDLVPAEVATVFCNHPKYKSKFWEDCLIQLEKDHPAFAAEIDKNRPLILPEDSN